MKENKKVYDFAIKWLNKFKDKTLSYKEFTNNQMGKKCSELGFQVYCGHTFLEKYGKINNLENFKKIIEELEDINLLGSTIYSKWSYFGTWVYNELEIIEDKNREWFIIALEHLAKLSKDKPYGDIKKIKIVSNKIFSEYDSPKPDDEIRQILTLESDGHVWFSAYTLRKRKNGKPNKNRMNNFKVSPIVIENIIEDITSYFIVSEGENKDLLLKDSRWVMEITNTEGKIYNFYDESFIYIDDINHEKYISDKIRKILKMSDLFLFDGKFEENIINKIVVDYHRVSKIKAKRPFDKQKKSFEWNYIEKLIVDRESKTIEHIQDVGLDCFISKKYTCKNGVENLLDELDIDYLLEKSEEKIKDFDLKLMPFDKKDYTITITLKNGFEKKISGTYDKKGLPSSWKNFVESVSDFMAFYGCGEILNSAIYGKDCDDIILCSVVFSKGHKTYYYISDSEDIEVGDKVLVPIWDDDHKTTAEVVRIEYISEKEMSIPIEKIKHIIKKC